MNDKILNSIYTIAIVSCTERTANDKKNVTFYTIEIYNHYNKNAWKLEKRYSEFDSLYKNLYKLYPKCPTIPGKGFLGFSLTGDEKERRRSQLDVFLKECIQRKDIVGSDAFREFIELDKNSPETSVFSHQKVSEFSDLPLGIRDFIYLKYEKVCFIACSDMHIASRIDAYITNVNLPWEKKSDSHITVGAVFAFKTEEDQETGEIIFEKLWAKSFPVQTGVISWDSDSSMLAIGLDDGRMFFYKTTPDSGYMYFDQICELKPHTERVMGIALDAKVGYIYSVSSDKKFILSEANHSSSSIEIAVSNSGYTNLFYDKKADRLFTTNESGEITIYSTQTNPPCEIGQVQIGDRTSIRGFNVELKKLYIFSGTMGGKISIIELGQPGKEKFLKEVSMFEGNPKIRIIKYYSKRHELITGDGNGKIVVWNLLKGQPVYAWDAHKGEITQMHYEEETRILISGSKDKTMKVWRLPEKWVDEEIESFEEKEIKSQKDYLAKTILKRKMEKMMDDSDEDDLNGWDMDGKVF